MATKTKPSNTKADKDKFRISLLVDKQLYDDIRDLSAARRESINDCGIAIFKNAVKQKSKMITAYREYLEKLAEIDNEENDSKSHKVKGTNNEVATDDSDTQEILTVE